VNARLSSLAQLLGRLFALALQFYPQAARREYAAEMQAVFDLKAGDAARRSAWTLFILAVREARDLPLAIGSAHFQAVRGHMNPIFPSTSDRTPWPAALLSLLPIFIGGTLRLIVSYQPGWNPRDGSQLFLYYLLASALIAAAGLAIGAAMKFPRWAYPYPVYLAFAIYSLAGYADSLYNWAFNGQNSFFIALALILLVLWLPGLRAFYRNIPQDWTLLSYALYGLVFYLLASIDYDEHPRLSLMAVLPSVLSLFTALAHLRIRSASSRIAVLLAGTFVGLCFRLAGIFTGMITILAGIIIGMLMLVIYSAILAVILLAPMLVVMLKRRKSAPGGTEKKEV
jgi:hypothetical protein